MAQLLEGSQFTTSPCRCFAGECRINHRSKSLLCRWKRPLGQKPTNRSHQLHLLPFGLWDPDSSVQITGDSEKNRQIAARGNIAGAVTGQLPGSGGCQPAPTDCRPPSEAGKMPEFPSNRAAFCCLRLYLQLITRSATVFSVLKVKIWKAPLLFSSISYRPDEWAT